MATVLTPTYGTATAITMTLASLASDTNLVAGRESNSVDNTSDLAVDSEVAGFTTTGTSPTANTQIEVWAIGSTDASNYSGGATGADANLTPQVKSLFKLLTIIPTTSTSNQQYNWGPFSVAQAFGGTMPRKWSIYIVHNTGVALNSTGGNHLVKYTPMKYTNT